MASPVDVNAKISGALTAVYKEELAHLDNPRKTLTSVTKVELSDEAFILYTPAGPNYRVLTREQSNSLKALAAANQMPEFEKVAHSLLKEALKLPAHVQSGFNFRGANAYVVNEADLNSVFKDKVIEGAKCFQVIKLLDRKNDQLTILFQGMPTEGEEGLNLESITKSLTECYKTAHTMFSTAETTFVPLENGMLRPTMKSIERSDDPFVNAIYQAFLRKMGAADAYALPREGEKKANE